MKRTSLFSLIFILFVAVLLPYFNFSKTSKEEYDFDTFSQEFIEFMGHSEDKGQTNIKIEKSLITNDMIDAEIFAEMSGDNVVFDYDSLSICHNEYKVDLGNNQDYFMLNEDQPISLMSASMIKEDKFYFSLNEVSKGLGYSLVEDDNYVTLSRDFETKRLIVYTYEDIDDYGAIYKLEGYKDYHILQYETEEQAKSAYERYLVDVKVDSVLPDRVLSLEELESTNIVSASSTRSYYSWGASTMGIDDFNEYLSSFGDLKDITVAVLDTGIDTDHPWLKNRIDFQNAKSFISTTANSSYSFEDDHIEGHGTHVSGIIADLTPSNVKILPIKVLDNAGNATTGTIFLAIDYIISLKENGYDSLVAMNMSLGGMVKIGTLEHNAYNTRIVNAYNKGILSIVAAGNEQQDVANVCPANIEKTITVSAIMKDRRGYSFAQSYSNYGRYITFTAPGSDINSAKIGGGTHLLSGTSMATPHITAVVALLLSDPAKNFSSLQEIYDMLLYYSVDLGEEGWDSYYGNGYIDITYANITKSGNVEFKDNDTRFFEPFYLELYYDSGYDATYTTKIYYTFDGTNPTTSSKLYTSRGILIDSSVKVTATAFVFDKNNKLVSMSNVSSKTYYLNGYDVETDYVVKDGVITGYNGDSTELYVPNRVNNEDVVAIGSYAFTGTNIEKITLPSTVITIENYAFYNCSSLKEITAHKVEEIGNYAFANCSGLVSIDDNNFTSLVYIGNFAFYNCYNLVSVSLSEVEEIGSSAFEMYSDSIFVINVSKLQSIEFSSVELVGDRAFYFCKNLSSASLPSVKIINSYAFFYCNFTKLELDSVRFIGNYAYYNNVNLTSVSMENLIYIGACVFQNNRNYTIALNSVSMPNLEYVGVSCFSDCKNITSLEFKNLRVIADSAFKGLTNLSSLDIPNVLKIGINGIYSCNNLTSLNLPNVKEIEYYGLGLSNLNELTLSNSIEVLDKIVVSNSCVIKGYSGSVAETYAKSNNITFVDLLTTQGITYEVVGGEVYITGYTSELIENTLIPSYIESLPVTRICESAFENCNKITKLNLSQLKTIEDNAFKNSTIEDINLSSVEEIGSYAFYNAINLKNVEITSVKNIGDFAFYGCKNFDEIQLSKQIKQIGQKALGYFTGDELVQDFTIYGYEDTCAEVYSNNNNIEFVSIFRELGSYYYSFYTTETGNKEIYLSSVNKGYTGAIIIPDTYDGYVISKIGSSCFEDCTFLTDVILPESIKIIASSAFKNCIILNSINLENVTEIGSSAFENCSVLGEVNAPKLSTINSYTFSGCSELSYVNIPNVKSIGSYAFNYCYYLKDIDLQSVESIASYAFANCINLTSLKLPNIVKIIEGFLYCSNLKEVFIGERIESIYRAFYYTNTNLTIYGYKETIAETYAYSNNYKFVAIDRLEIINDLKIRNFVPTSQEEITLSVDAEGYDLSYKWYKIDKNFENKMLISENTNEITLNINENKNYIFYVEVYDWTRNFLTSTYSEIVVANSSQYYKITINTIGNGNVLYNNNIVSGNLEVYGGENVTFKLQANEGYVISNVVLDGVKQGKTPTFTIKNINENHELKVSFEIKMYRLSVTTGSNGISSVQGNVSVEHGEDYSIAFTPDLGYHVSEIYLNNVLINMNESTDEYLVESLLDRNSKPYIRLTIKNVCKEYTIQVNFDLSKYTITIKTNGNGRAYIDGEKEAYFGESREVFFVPESGNKLSSVKINGEKVSVSDNSYIIDNISGDILVEVEFKTTFKTIYSIMILVASVFIIILFITYVLKRMQKHKKS